MLKNLYRKKIKNVIKFILKILKNVLKFIWKKLKNVIKFILKILKNIINQLDWLYGIDQFYTDKTL